MQNVNSSCKSSCQMLSEQQPAGWTRASTGPSLCGLADWAGRDNKPYCLTCSACPTARFMDIQRALFAPPTPQLRLKSQSKRSVPQIRICCLSKLFITWCLFISRVTFFINPWHWPHNRSWACFWLVPVMNMVTFFSKILYNTTIGHVLV